ncbi:MAG: hypothetical protein FWF06_08465 [Symbiobacteriaceae bacterium]|nr:hypothetical protein [Symbiobacteriaceae bacterium]
MNTAAISDALMPLLSKWLIRDSNRVSLTAMVFFIFFIAMVIYYWRVSLGSQPMPKLRRIAGLDAIDESIGRATEMGRPIVFVPGMSGFSAPTYAALTIMGYVADQVARYDTRMIVCYRYPEVLAVGQSVVQTAYVEQGKQDAYRTDDQRFLSSEQWGFASGVCGILQRERAAAQHIFGSMAAEAIVLAEVGNVVGAIQIAGQTGTLQQPYLFAACDYTLMVEELYVASAYLSQDRLRTGMLAAQDISKIVLIVVMILGIVLQTFGSNLIDRLLTLY